MQRYAEDAASDAEKSALLKHIPGCSHCSAQMLELQRKAGQQEDPSTAAEHTQTVGPPGALPAPGTDGELKLKRGDMLGRYVVLDLLGEGGMGTVYVAFDPELDRRLAIKLVKPRSELSDHRSQGRLRLLREAQAMARLAHPNVVAVYDVGIANGRVFMAMELVTGTTVKDWLKQEPRSARAVLEVFLAAGEGLKAAHDAGMVHRDLKAANILLGNDGRVRVSDFGLARATTDEEPLQEPVVVPARSLNEPGLLSSPLTMAASLVGTPAYMAPEQFEGKPADSRSDQYSFCVALYEALYGERPFQADDYAGLVARIRKGEMTPPSRGRRVQPWLRKVLLRGLELEPEHRYGSMDELLRALRSDPTKNRVRNATVAATLAVVATAVGGWRYANSRAAAECAREEATLTGIWDGPVQEAMEQAFLATGKSYASAVWQQTSRLLTDHANRLVAFRTDACLATRARHEQSEAVLALRMGCLNQKREELHALTATLAKADAELMNHAIEAAGRLNTLEDCNEVEALAANEPPLALRPKVEELRANLPELRALASTRQFKLGREKAKKLAEQVRILGHLPLEAETLLLLGEHDTGFRDALDAETAYVGALAAAVQTNQRQMIAKAALGLMGAEDKLARYDEARRWALFANAAIARNNNVDELMCEYFLNLGTIDLHQGKYKDSMEHLGQGLERCGRGPKPNTFLMARTHNVRGITAKNLGDYKQSRADYERALEQFTSVVGASHVEVAKVLNNLGELARRQNQVEEARPLMERSFKMFSELDGPGSFNRVYPLDSLGQLHLQQGEYEEAVKVFERCLEVIARFGENHDMWPSAITGIGEAYLGMGKLPEARSHLERSLASLERSGLKSGAIQPRTRFALARALEKSRLAPDRARKLAQQARDEYAASPANADLLAPVDEWLRAH